MLYYSYLITDDVFDYPCLFRCDLILYSHSFVNCLLMFSVHLSVDVFIFSY